MEVVLEKLSKRFGGVKVADDINLEIKDAEFISLVGPSGCGRTTAQLGSGLFAVTRELP